MLPDMPLPLILLPIALAGGSAAIQAASKIRAHRKLTRLYQELDEARQRHIRLMRSQYDRQKQLCAELGLPEPPLPAILQPQPEPEPKDGRRFRIPLRLPFRKQESLLHRPPTGSSATIIGRHGASFVASTVWKTSSGPIMRFVQPVSARLLTFAPKFLTAGGSASGSIAASTGIRFALSAFSIAGLIIGPALAAWCVLSEYRKVKKARAEQGITLDQYRAELDNMTRRTAELEARSTVGS